MSRPAAALKTVIAREAQAAAPTTRADNDDDGPKVEGYHPLLPAGLWLEARFVAHDTAKIFNAPKVFLRFQVTEAGEHFGTKLFRAFRARRLDGRPGPNGRFVLHPRGDLCALIVRLLDVRVRPDRVSLRDLKRCLFRVQTRTVTINHLSQEIPPALHYTTIGGIERAE